MTATGDSDPGSGRDRRLERPRIVALVAAAVLVELVSWYFATAGTFSHWHFYNAFLNDLADGFRQGHLHLSVEPPAALVARPNPFDPGNRDLWYWDASLYHGHYYLYWGPLPALLLALAKTLFRISTPVGDESVVFGLATLQLVAGTLFIERAGRRLFVRMPVTLEVAAIFVLGFSNPTLYNLGRGDVYEAAIVGGQAFLLLGLVFAFDAIWAKDLRRGSLVAAGTAWVAAFSCRSSLAPAVALLVVATLLGAAGGEPERWRRRARMALWLCAPVAIGLFVVLGYNRLRFDAWLEFGRTYQLSWIQMGAAPRFLRANLYAYLRRPPIWSCRFPFAYAILDMGMRAFPPGTELPANYFVYEQVAGLLPAVPWSWFTPVALVAAARELWLTRRVTPFSWAVGVTAVAATAALVPCLVLSTATNRYLGDIGGTVVLLGTLGAGAAHESVRARPVLRKLVVAAALLLAIPSMGIGLALGIKGQYAHFEANNPPLYQKLVRRLSVCRGEIPPEPK
jgi:hypothetical protein